MKTRIKNLFLLLASTGLLAMPAVAQTFTTLHFFTVLSSYTNSDGDNPFGGLVLSGGTLYGTADFGGSGGSGTVFAVNTNGMGFTNLYTFMATDPDTGTNSDGAYPSATLILSGGTLYGTAGDGGTNGNGTVFAVTTNGSFSVLHTFTALVDFTNSDGCTPHAGLILSGNILYGTTLYGGASGGGTVFAITTNGSFSVLHTFTAGAYDDEDNYTNSDGADPIGGLVLSGGTLYGTANEGGTNGNGTVFAVTTNGSFSVLHTFGEGPYDEDDSTNSDGANPYGTLVLSGNTLYGTAAFGSTNDDGTVFAVNTDGTGFTNLYTFTATDPDTGTNSDGANPSAGLILSGNTLYGTALYGGNDGNGTVFSLSLPPPRLAIILSGTNVILAWPTYAPGVTLQSATNIVPPAVWNTNLPSPVVVNGQNTVTNPISGTQQFYRLSQ